MPDGRFLSKSISVSEQLASVSLEAALLFTWCIPHLDSDGRMVGNPAAVKATAVPLRSEITLKKIPALLRELAGAPIDDRGRPLIYWYEVQGRPLLEFPGFAGHQRGLRKDREAKSRLPARKHQEARDLRETSNGTPAQVRSNSGGGPEEVHLSEEKKYVSTSKISVGSGPPENSSDIPPESGSAPEGATPQEIRQHRDRIRAGFRQESARG